jgi:hypothetical protein
VIPLVGKKPILNDWPTRATCDVGEPEWRSATGVGLLTGERAGFFVLDVDAGKGGLESLAALEQKHGALPATWTTLTGGGGRHYYFRWPGFPVSNSTGKLGQGLDVKGERGQVVAPPSRHESGNIYRWAEGRGPVEVEIAPAPEWLLERLREPERKPAAAPAPPPEPRSDVRRRASAYLAKMDRAISGSGGHNALWNAAQAMVRGFNLGEDTYDLIVSEYNPRCEPPWSEEELRHKIRGAVEKSSVPWGYLLDQDRPLPASAAGAQIIEPARFREEPGCDDGDDPYFIPFTGANVPPFPVEALPLPVARYVEAVATHIQVPPDGPAVMAIATIAAACARRIRVRRLIDGYEQPLNLYLLGLGEPGERKSQIVSEVVRPLREYEAREADRLADQIALEAQLRQLDEDRTKVIRRVLASGRGKGDPQALRAELERLTLALARPPLRAPRLASSAPTQGGLEKILVDNGERMAILGAEGDVFGIVAGRYSGNKSAPPDMGIYLSAWSGDAVDSDRVTRPGARLKAPALTIGLFVQPQVFREISNIYGADEKGLTSRFLIAVVESRAHTQQYFGRPMDLDRRDAWARQVTALLDGLPAAAEERIITLPSEILGPAKAFHDEVTSQMAPGGPLSLPSLRAFGSKLRGQVERLLGVLHVAEHGVQAPDTPCSEDTAANAVQIARYFLAHGLAARSEAGSDPVILRAQRLAEYLVYQGTEIIFTRRDVQANRRAGRTPEEVDQVLRELVRRGYLKQGRTVRSTPGATGPVYTLTAAAIASMRARK